MTCKDVGDITLITKGTLTGVVDRLDEKGLVERWSVEGDGRKTIIALTRKGERVYQKEFPKHIEFLKQKFDGLTSRDRKQAMDLLVKIKELF
jgi:DNA-binding MarR family transcriptional regulator